MHQQLALLQRVGHKLVFQDITSVTELDSSRRLRLEVTIDHIG